MFSLLSHSHTQSQHTYRASHFCSPGVSKKLISYRENIITICVCIAGSFDVHFTPLMWQNIHKNLNNVWSSASSLCIFLSFFLRVLCQCTYFTWENIFPLKFETYLFTDLDVVILEEGMGRTSHWGQRPGVDLGSNKS